MGKHGQAIRARIKAFYERIKEVTRIKRVIERAKEITRKKNFFEWVRMVTSCILALTVVFGYLQWRATIKDQAANRFLDIIDKLGNRYSESVRAGAVITMGAHLNENYKDYHNQSIPVLVIHLAKEHSSTVRTKILDLLKDVKTDHVIEPLSSEIRELIEIEKRSTSSLFEPYITGEPNEILLDMSELLVTVLGKMPPEKLDLSGFYLVDWSPEATNWEQADFEQFRLVRGSLKQANLKKANLRGAQLYRSDLTGAFLQKADLGGASLREVILKNAQLNDAILESTNLDYSDLSEANLTDANLAEASLVNANMEGATLEGADLFAADLEGAMLASAHLKGANLTNANLTNAILKNANLTNASLVGANLTDANMLNATLQGADLFKADLTYANLASADLKGANLESAILDGANLEGADLRAALLFRIDPNKFQSDLDKDTISEILQQEFEDNGFYLSHNTAVSVEEKDRRWLINDKDYEQTYTVRKEEWLNICKETKFVLTDIKKARNWQKAIFDDDVRQKLSNQQK